MTDYPCSNAEWHEVMKRSGRLVQASQEKDDAQCDLALQDLRAFLTGLMTKYGRHPVLLETLADFEEHSETTLDVYEEALSAAASLGLPTYTSRIARAHLFFDWLEDHSQAKIELERARAEVEELGDESEQADFNSLHAKCVELSGEDDT